MSKIKAILTAFCVSLLFATQSQAGARAWDIDKAHSNFYFSVDHIFSKVHGFFGDYSGEVHFDPKNLAESKMVFEIDVKSINTAIAKRDKHLLSADFFDAAKHPKLVFTSNKILSSGENTFDVHGVFTVKGKKYDLVLPLTLEGIKDHPMEKGKEVAGFNGKITIDRLAYGIGSGKFFEYGVVGKDVEILVTLEVLSTK
ncbi:YceI family protein [Desulfopila sp. IMCC35008]|uniref:YceI family protein n=1 Tax=Desulfopila sp. IMCC35008 TaxID=2653858 RepID=UPI0013D5AB65|nr:YceI family protein [Desulfopila sp. IMCC35008]